MRQHRKTKNIIREKTSGIKLHIGVDILGLTHTIRITTDMISYYWNHTYNLFHVKKLLADSAYSGKKFANPSQKNFSADVNVVKRNKLHKFTVIPKYWIISLGSITIVVFGKIVEDLSIILFKLSLLHLFVFFSLVTKQILNK